MIAYLVYDTYCSGFCQRCCAPAIFPAFVMLVTKSTWHALACLKTGVCESVTGIYPRRVEPGAEMNPPTVGKLALGPLPFPLMIGCFLYTNSAKLHVLWHSAIQGFTPQAREANPGREWLQAVGIISHAFQRSFYSLTKM